MYSSRTCTLTLLQIFVSFLIVSWFYFTPIDAYAKITSFTSYPSGNYLSSQTITLSGTYNYGGSAIYPTLLVAYKLDGAVNASLCWSNPSYPGLGISGTWSCTLPPLAGGTHSIQVYDVHNAPASSYAWPMASVYGVTTFYVYPPGAGPVPTVTTYAASNVTASGALLRGFADLNGLSSGAGWFRYDTVSSNLNCAADVGGTRTPDFNFIDPWAGNAFGIPPTTSYSFSNAVSGLTMGTTYYYCAIAATANGRNYGSIQSFTPTPPPPTVTTDSTHVTSLTTATLKGFANPQGNSATGWFRYSATNPGFVCNDTFGTRVPATGGVALGAGTTSVNLDIDVTGLVPGTRYWYCALASNAVGTGKGMVLNFLMPLSLPNLASGAVTLASGSLTQGSNVRFSSKVTNTSSVSINSPFRNNFTYRWGTSGPWIEFTNRLEFNIAGGSSLDHTSSSFNLSTSGTLQIQYCADSSMQVSESDETENCTQQSFTVTGLVPPPPPLTSPALTASAYIVDLNVSGSNSVSLSWDTNNGNEALCTLSGGSIGANPLSPRVGDFETGSQSVVINAKTTYTLTCPHGSDTVTIEVVPISFET